jgi:hypothetical protein
MGHFYETVLTFFVYKPENNLNYLTVSFSPELPGFGEPSI